MDSTVLFKCANYVAASYALGGGYRLFLGSVRIFSQYCPVKDLHVKDLSFENSSRQGRAVHFLIPVFRFEF